MINNYRSTSWREWCASTFVLFVLALKKIKTNSFSDPRLKMQFYSIQGTAMPIWQLASTAASHSWLITASQKKTNSCVSLVSLTHHNVQVKKIDLSIAQHPNLNQTEHTQSGQCLLHMHTQAIFSHFHRREKKLFITRAMDDGNY